MTRDDILAKVRDVLVDALAVDEDDVKPSAVLTRDLGAESIDFLDIGFKLEQAFGLKIGQGELFPDGMAQSPDMVKDGRITPKGIDALRARLPHVDFSSLASDPRVERVGELFTVEAIINFVERKLQPVT